MMAISNNLKNVLTLVSGTALAGLISVGLLPVITRLYSVEEFGILALILSFIQFWSTLQMFRYEQSIFTAKTKKELGYILWLCFFILAFMTIIGFLCFVVLKQNNFFGFGIVPNNLLWFVPIVTLGLGIFLLLRNLNVRLENYKDVSISTVYRVLGDFTAKIGLGLMGYGVFGLLIGELIGAWSSSGRLFKFSIPYIKVSFSNFSLIRILSIAKRNKNYPFFDLPSAVLDKLTFIIPIPAIMAIYGPFEAGLFAMSYRVSALPCSKIASSFGDVFQAQFALKIREKKISDAVNLFNSSLKKYFFLALAILGLSVIVAPLIASTVFGEEWKDIGTYIALMALWHFFAFFVSPLSRIIPVLRLSKYKFIYDVSALISTVSAFTVIYILSLNIFIGVFLISIANSISYLIYLGVLIMIIKKQRGLI